MPQISDLETRTKAKAQDQVDFKLRTHHQLTSIHGDDNQQSDLEKDIIDRNKKEYEEFLQEI